MATDIHIHLEYRSRKTKRYKYGGAILIARNYGIFDVIMDDKNALFPIRGLPGDVTKETSFHHRQWVGDAHHTSWLSTIEFAACIVEAYIRKKSIEQLRFYKQHVDLFNLLSVFNDTSTKQHEDMLWDYEELLKIMLDYDDEEECRIVFWLDN